MENAENQQDVDFKVDLSAPPKEEEAVTETEAAEATEEKQEEAPAESEDNTTEEQTENKPSEEPKVEKTREELFNDLLQDKYQMKVEDLENVLSNKESRELPEDVEKYLEYRNETKRGMEDFLKLQKDYDNVNEGELLREYYRHTKNGLDNDDIESLIDVKFGYNEGADETLVKTKKLEMKEELYKAKQFFESQKDKYKKPLESSELPLSEQSKEAVEFYQLYKKQQEEQSKRSESVRKTFEEKTSSLFNDEFKGFEFKIGEEKVVFKPKDLSEVKSKQSDLSNFINAHTDENGALIDAKKYHTALSMALNPEAYAKFFYEQGKASGIGNVVGEGKNIDMGVRSSVDSTKPGPKFRVVEDDRPFMSGLKINKR
jgi:hypothetical protein